MEKLIYLDNAATTALRPEVFDAMKPYFLENYSNPNSIYTFAQQSKKVMEESRETIADLIGAKPKEIYFTAGGSESDNWAIKGCAEAFASKGKHIITTKIEHHAVLHTCQYLEKKDTKLLIWMWTKTGWSGQSSWSRRFVRIRF